MILKAKQELDQKFKVIEDEKKKEAIVEITKAKPISKSKGNNKKGGF